MNLTETEVMELQRRTRARAVRAESARRPAASSTANMAALTNRAAHSTRR